MRNLFMKSMHTCISAVLTALLITGCNKYNYEPTEVIDETYVHTYGFQVPELDWNARGKNGRVVSKLANGVCVTKNYVNGILEGETTYSFPHENIIQKLETYSQSRLVKERTFYSSGSPKQEIAYSLDGSKRYTDWYESASPLSVETYDASKKLLQAEYYDISQNKDASVNEGEGMRIVRDSYGQIISKDTIQNGIMVSRTTFHPNGSPREVIPYSNGIVEGVRRTFLPAGEPNTTEEWVNGKQEGLTTLFRNGEKASEAYYINGQKHGREKQYRDGNEIVAEISWKDGKRHGHTVTYMGSNIRNEWYYQGEPVSQGNYEILIRSLNNAK